MDVDLFDPGTAQEIVDPGVPDATDPGVPDPGSPDLSGQDVPPDAPDGEAGEVVEEQFYPSPELFLKILGPSSDHFAASAGSLAAVTGILFGEAESITWSLGSKSGVIEPQHYWLSDAIPLDPGDNRITVTATGNGMTATDSILLVHTPGFLFTGRPVARPDVAFVGTSVDVVFTLALGQSSLVGSDTVDLYGTQADGSPGKKIGTMKDDGDTWDSGDEIPGDGLFTLRSGVKCGAEGSNGYRVGLTVKTGVSSYVAYSPPVFVDCVAHVYQSDCQTVVDTQKAAQSLYESKLAKDGEAAARAAVADFFKTSAVVKESGLDADGYGLWAYYKSGILGVLSLAPAGLRAGPGDDPEEAGGPESVSSALLGGDEIASKRASLFSPFFGEFGVDDETQAIEDVLSAKSCPTYDVSGPHSGTNATLSRMRA